MREPPSAEPGDEHPFDELVASSPPATPEEFIEFVSGYLLSLGAIAATQADPAVASQQALEATTRLIAGLSPAGSTGPVHLFAPLMEVLLARQTGASLDKTVLFKAARRRGKGRPPGRPALVLMKARAAAVMTLLMESGTPEKKAARLVANRLQRAGVKFDRANANPINNIKRWRSEAEGDDRSPMALAYRDALTRLRAIITPESSPGAQQTLLKKVDELAGRFGEEPG